MEKVCHLPGVSSKRLAHELCPLTFFLGIGCPFVWLPLQYLCLERDEGAALAVYALAFTVNTACIAYQREFLLTTHVFLDHLINLIYRWYAAAFFAR